MSGSLAFELCDARAGQAAKAPAARRVCLIHTARCAAVQQQYNVASIRPSWTSRSKSRLSQNNVSLVLSRLSCSCARIQVFEISLTSESSVTGSVTSVVALCHGLHGLHAMPPASNWAGRFLGLHYGPIMKVCWSVVWLYYTRRSRAMYGLQLMEAFSLRPGIWSLCASHRWTRREREGRTTWEKCLKALCSERCRGFFQSRSSQSRLS